MRQIASRDHELARVQRENAALLERLQSMDTGTGAASPTVANTATVPPPTVSSQDATDVASAPSGATVTGPDGGSGAQATGEGGGAAAGGGGGAPADAAQKPGAGLLRRHNRELLRDLALCRRELGTFSAHGVQLVSLDTACAITGVVALAAARLCSLYPAAPRRCALRPSRVPTTEQERRSDFTCVATEAGA